MLCQPIRGTSPNQVSDVPIGFRGQGADDLHAVSSHDGYLILKPTTTRNNYSNYSVPKITRTLLRVAS